MVSAEGQVWCVRPPPLILIVRRRYLWSTLTRMELLILRNTAGTHVDVRNAAEYSAVPAGLHGHVLAPGESYLGVPYEVWRDRLNQTVEIPTRRRAVESRQSSDSPGEPEAGTRAPVRNSRGRRVLGNAVALLSSGFAILTFLLFLRTVGDHHAHAVFYLGQFFLFSAFAWSAATETFTAKQSEKRTAPVFVLRALSGILLALSAIALVYAWIQFRAH